MKSILIEFTMHIDKQNEESTKDFVNKFIFMDMINDIIFFENSLSKADDQDQKKYKWYIKTLKSFRETIANTQLQVHALENAKEEIKVKCGFMYYENEISNEIIMVNEIFKANIKKNEERSKDLRRLLKDPRFEEIKLKEMIQNYDQARNCLIKAQSTLSFKNQDGLIKK